MYQRSRSVFVLFQTICPEATGQTEAHLHKGDKDPKFTKTGEVTLPRCSPYSYPVWYKPWVIFFSRSEKPMILKLGMQHWVLEFYKVPSNNDPMLTFFLLCFLMHLYGKFLNGGLLRNSWINSGNGDLLEEKKMSE